MCINLCAWGVSTSLGITLISPFDINQNVTINQSDFPQLYNTSNSNSLFNNATSPKNVTGLYGGTGMTGDNKLFGFLPNYFEVPFYYLWLIFSLLGGGFLFNAISVWGYPAWWTFIVTTGFAFWGIYTLVYYAIGKG